MIRIKRDGKIFVPDDDAFIGYEGDNLNTSKQFFVEGVTDTSYVYRMYLTFDDGSTCYFLLNSSPAEGGTRLVWNVTSQQINKGGIVRMQIKASNSRGTVFHTEPTALLVQTSIEFTDVYRDIDNAEFLQHEQYLNNLKAEAEEIYNGIQGAHLEPVPVPNSTQAVQSNGIYNALAGKLSFEHIARENGAALDIEDVEDLELDTNKIYFVLLGSSVLYSGSHPCKCILIAITATNQIAIDINGRVFSRYKDINNNWSAFSENTSALSTRVSTLESLVGTANAVLEAVLLGA